MSAVNSHLVLVLGGARSGKSRFAEGRIAARPGRRGPISRPRRRWTTRFETHREASRRTIRWMDQCRRHTNWQGDRAADPRAPVLVDYLTLWLTNRLLAGAGSFARMRRAGGRARGAVRDDRGRLQRGRPRHRAGQRARAGLTTRRAFSIRLSPLAAAGSSMVAGLSIRAK